MTARSPEALTCLHDRGAHFVLCRDKRPLPGFPWRSHTPDLDCVLAHPGNVGLIPYSVSTSALDVDTGEPGQLSLFHQPLVVVRSRRPGPSISTTGTTRHAATSKAMERLRMQRRSPQRQRLPAVVP